MYFICILSTNNNENRILCFYVVWCGFERLTHWRCNSFIWLNQKIVNSNANKLHMKHLSMETNRTFHVWERLALCWQNQQPPELFYCHITHLLCVKRIFVCCSGKHLLGEIVTCTQLQSKYFVFYDVNVLSTHVQCTHIWIGLKSASNCIFVNILFLG